MTTLIDRHHCAVVLVDYQQRLLPAIHRSAEVLAHAVSLADIARVLGLPLIGTEQNPAGLGPNDAAVRTRCDITLPKMHFDACADGLLDALRAKDSTPVHDVVIAGCEAHVCLLQTALGLLRAGLPVWVAADACGARHPASHALAMDRLRHAGAGIVNVEMVAFEWLRTCEDARFRRVLAVLKQAST
jgi:nicotinamidase-related amidase